jgi:hypothetical protein
MTCGLCQQMCLLKVPRFLLWPLTELAFTTKQAVRAIYQSSLMRCLRIIKQLALKNVTSCLNTKNSFYLETSGGRNFYLNFNVVHFFNSSVN